MNNNGENKTETSKNGNRINQRNIGSGLRDILAEQSLFDSKFNDLQEHIKAARIGAAILELIDIVEARYQPIIFKSVAAYRAVANEESTDDIARKLTEIEHHRMVREKENQQPKRKWYFLYLW